jgi:hypothetical protein
MKTTAFPLFCALASIILPVAAQSAHALSPIQVFETDCKAKADQVAAMRITTANLAHFNKVHSSDVDLLKINPNYSVPVITVNTPPVVGPNDVTLIVLIHNKAGSTTDDPIVDAICHDQNHNFAIDKGKESITFASDDNQRLYLRFRLDTALHNTTWKTPPGDSVEMSPTASATSQPAPGAPLWCEPVSQKHVDVDGRDMWFRMCQHYGQTRFYKYSVHMLVNGQAQDIDPIIVHEPQ